MNEPLVYLLSIGGNILGFYYFFGVKELLIVEYDMEHLIFIVFVSNIFSKQF